MGQENEKKYDNLVIAEYNYLAQMSFNANEDRARSSQFFFVTFGTLIAALISLQLESFDLSQLLSFFSITLLVIVMFGLGTIIQLTRLRMTWIECIRAMNQIKEYAIEVDEDLSSVFLWKTKDTPAAYKFWSISSINALLISIFCGLSLGISIAFYYLSKDPSVVNWYISVIPGIIFIVLSYMLFYQLPIVTMENKGGANVK